MLKRIIEIDAPQEFAYDVISDVEKYPEFLSTTNSVSKNGSGDQFDASFRISVVKTIEYTLKFKVSRPQRIEWSLVRGDLMKKNDGGWTFESISPQKTRAIYEIDVEFGWLVPKTMVNMLTEVQLPDLMKSFKNRVESLYLSKKDKTA